MTLHVERIQDNISEEDFRRYAKFILTYFETEGITLKQALIVLTLLKDFIEKEKGIKLCIGFMGEK